ncbi:hypothetical protein VTK56DRAFT_6126 [Thermocarpiscus australiensis]
MALDIVRLPSFGDILPRGPLKPIHEGFATFFEFLFVTLVDAANSADKLHQIGVTADSVGPAQNPQDCVAAVAEPTGEHVGQVEAMADLADTVDAAELSSAVDDVAKADTEDMPAECSIPQVEAEEVLSSAAADFEGIPAAKAEVLAEGCSHAFDALAEEVCPAADEEICPAADEVVPAPGGEETLAAEDELVVCAIPEDTAVGIQLEDNSIDDFDTSLPSLEEGVQTLTKDTVDDTTLPENHTESESEVESEDVQGVPVENHNSAMADTTIVVPIYPIIYEDDFDAGTSSVFQPDFLRFMDIDRSWSVPQLIEKGKSQRDLLREKFTSSLPQTSLQNLQLERASRALTIDGTSPVRKAAMTAAPVGEPTPVSTPVSEEYAERRVGGDGHRNEAAPETISKSEGTVVELAQDTPRSQTHSRRSSSSSDSYLSQEAVFDRAARSDTPATEHSGIETPAAAKDEAAVVDAQEANCKPVTEEGQADNVDLPKPNEHEGVEEHDTAAHDDDAADENATGN